MPEKELVINGVSRLVWVESLDSDNWRAEEHQYRREGVLLRRRYFNGTQYQADNLEKKTELYPGTTPLERMQKALPEHQRKHAYSTQIKDGVQFLADQIAGALILESDEEDVQQFIDDLFQESGITYRWQEVTQDTLVAGDVAVRVIPRYDALPDEPGARVEFWPAEDIEIDYSEDNWMRMEAVRFERYTTEPTGPGGEWQEVRYVHVFRMSVPTVDDLAEEPECIEEIFRNDDEEPEEVRRLGLPFIPWVHVTTEKEDLRSMWGKSVISTQVMESADRYNAVCQLQYLVTRYNSFATLAVVGDAAHLKADGGDRLAKDIADVMTFPGGTGVQAIELPTDVELFEVHKETLIDSMYEALGLTRVDRKAIATQVALSGYALEILNRKSQGTFTRIVENMREGIRAIIELAFAVDAFVKNSTVDANGVRDFRGVDVDEVWPNREYRVDFGSTYVVDDLAVEREFGISLISRKEALRKKGYSEDEIDQILLELADEDEQKQESIMQAMAGNGTRLTTSQTQRGQ